MSDDKETINDTDSGETEDSASAQPETPNVPTTSEGDPAPSGSGEGGAVGGPTR